MKIFLCNSDNRLKKTKESQRCSLIKHFFKGHIVLLVY